MAKDKTSPAPDNVQTLVREGLRKVASELSVRGASLVAPNDPIQLVTNLGRTIQSFLPILEQEQKRSPFWADAAEGFLQSAHRYIDKEARPDQCANLRAILSDIQALCHDASPARQAK